MTTPPRDGMMEPSDGPPAMAPAAPDLDTFFAVSLDLMVIRDAGFRIVKANPAWERVLGWSVAELEGQPMLSFIHPDDAAPSQGEMVRMTKDEEVHGFINRYRCKDGRYRHFEWRAKRQGELVYGVARDVTERLAHDAEMAAAREAAEAANKAKSMFLANMSHEIRTPLNGVIGVAAALARTELSADQREMVELILSSGSTLERIVSDVLDFSKIEAGHLDIDLRPFDLRAELDGVLEMFRLRAQEKGLAFPVLYGETARGEFHGDATRIRQVLANLLSNAVKFTAEGAVRTTLDIVDGDDGEPARLEVQVADTGVGFDAETAGRLFQRFSQADESITRRFGGTGLGLSISQALVQLMGGEITASASPGRGSTFRVSLPLTRVCALQDYDRRAVSGRETCDAAASPVLRQGLKVLLAEDHPINRRVVELILAPAGVELTIVEDGSAAIEAFAASSFDLVLMDMQMPVMDGLAATRAVRELEAARASARTPVIVLSANAMRQHQEDALAAGADLHLPKPVTAASLLSAVSEAIGQSAAARAG